MKGGGEYREWLEPAGGQGKNLGEAPFCPGMCASMLFILLPQGAIIEDRRGSPQKTLQQGGSQWRVGVV